MCAPVARQAARWMSKWWSSEAERACMSYNNSVSGLLHSCVDCYLLNCVAIYHRRPFLPVQNTRIAICTDRFFS